MSENLTPEQKEVLEQLDPSRRSFVQKLMAGGVAATSLPLMSSFALADDDDDGGPNHAKGKGKGGGGGKGKGKGGGGKGKGKGGGGGKGKGGGGRPDPAILAARLIQLHDKDGDRALNVRELAAALESLGQRQRGDGFFGKGKGKGNGGGFQGKGKGKGER
jgi:hypothetical protein